MDFELLRDELKLASFVLRYPDDNFYELLKQSQDSLIEQTEEDLKPFLTYLLETDHHTLCENYVYTFDFGQSANLYLTYAKHGEERERGNALVELKKLYQKAGFEVVDQELPDYLPLMLEFAAITPSTFGLELLTQYLPRMKEIESVLQELDSPYAIVIHHIVSKLTTWDALNVKQEVES